ncbi:MAG: hypothetical protein NC218_11575 [Acetobacter sp.]|nr:hypothetical protein [Acetobacter sp.]
MRILLVLFLSLLISVPTIAEEHIPQEQKSKPEIIENINTSVVAETPAPIVYEIEKEIIPLPTCDDARLMNKTKEYITAYFSKSDNKSVLFRRRRDFLLKNMGNFSTENIANYKTAATSPVSDEIIELQMNHKVLAENIRLCKKQAANKLYDDIYLLIYPSEKGYEVNLLNLDKPSLTQKNIFEY